MPVGSQKLASLYDQKKHSLTGKIGQVVQVCSLEMTAYGCLVLDESGETQPYNACMCESCC